MLIISTIGFNIEVGGGFEPPYPVLQTDAWPLGQPTIFPVDACPPDGGQSTNADAKIINYSDFSIKADAAAQSGRRDFICLLMNLVA